MDAGYWGWMATESTQFFRPSYLNDPKDIYDPEA